MAHSRAAHRLASRLPGRWGTTSHNETSNPKHHSTSDACVFCDCVQMLLLSDGSVTRHLQLMADQGVHVECLEMAKVGADRGGLPPGTALLPGPLVQRQVLLRMPDPQGPAYVYAASWWNADSVDDYLRWVWVPSVCARPPAQGIFIQIQGQRCVSTCTLDSGSGTAGGGLALSCCGHRKNSINGVTRGTWPPVSICNFALFTQGQERSHLGVPQPGPHGAVQRNPGGAAWAQPLLGEVSCQSLSRITGCSP